MNAPKRYCMQDVLFIFAAVFFPLYRLFTVEAAVMQSVLELLTL